MEAENCRLPKGLWKKDVPAQVAIRLSYCIGREQSLGHPEMFVAFQNSLPTDAPFSPVLEELCSPGGFEHLGFTPKFRQDGTPVRNHNADDVLHEVLC